MKTPHAIYRIQGEDDILERIPFGCIDEAVFFHPSDFLCIYDDSSSERQTARSHINMFLDLSNLRTVSYHFCKQATRDEIRNLELYCKTREFIDAVAIRWEDFRIEPPGPFDKLGAKMTIHWDATEGSASLGRKFAPDETITYREVIDDYNFLRATFFQAQN